MKLTIIIIINGIYNAQKNCIAIIYSRALNAQVRDTTILIFIFLDTRWSMRENTRSN